MNIVDYQCCGDKDDIYEIFTDVIFIDLIYL